MCGMFGVLWHSADTALDEHRLKETVNLLHHRGPDSYGIYADVGIGLVHTRLSLVDLNPRSDQPFWDEQRRYCLLYNGEIYNFEELRSELEQRGVQFRTTSDTEVLLEWLINCGVETTLPRLEGMFAFALYDVIEKTVVLARDRFGIKPMFVYDENDAFIFASEIQAMRNWIKFEPDHQSISSFLYGFDGPTKGYTFFKNVKCLAPGAVVKIRIGEPAEYSRFFSIPDFWDQDQAVLLKRRKPQQIVDQVEQLLFESVKMQLFADARVGALCSGGVDSSLIMAMAARFHNNLAIFHADVVGPNSESRAAARLAKHLRLDLRVVQVRDHDFIQLMPEIIEHYGHPFYHTPHSVPFLMVSKLVRRDGVKAVLSGEGSDECYLGYDWLAPDIRKLWKLPTATLKELLALLTGRRKIRRRQRVRSPEMVLGLHNRFEVALEMDEIRARLQKSGEAGNDFNYVKSLNLLNYNLRALLHRNDSMGMAASIESRFPFLDSQLVKLAVNMPVNCKIRFSPTAFNNHHYFFADKWVLREVAGRYLPEKLSHRAKRPFPVDAFQRMQIPPAFFEKSFITDLFGLTPREMGYLIENSHQDLRLKLLHLEVWAQIFLRDLPRPSIINKLRDYIVVRPLN